MRSRVKLKLTLTFTFKLRQEAKQSEWFHRVMETDRHQSCRKGTTSERVIYEIEGRQPNRGEPCVVIQSRQKMAMLPGKLLHRDWASGAAESIALGWNRPSALLNRLAANLQLTQRIPYLPCIFIKHTDCNQTYNVLMQEHLKCGQQDIVMYNEELNSTVNSRMLYIG